jgi:hypothetical protein
VVVRRGRCAGGAHCTTRRRNAHRTEDCEVRYPWHPWFGRVVCVYEVIEKAADVIVRCHLDEAGSDRWLELPAWMLDRAACVLMRVAAQARVDVASLAALQALLIGASSAGSCGCASSNAPVLGTGRNACDQKPGDAHATSTSPSSAGSQRSSSARSVPSALCGQRPAGAGVGCSARGDPPEGDLAHGAAALRTRTRRSASDVGGRVR